MLVLIYINNLDHLLKKNKGLDFRRKNTIKNYSGEEHTDLFDNEGWRCCLFLLLS